MDFNPDFEDMTVMDLTTWLGQQGIPSEFCAIFSGNISLNSKQIVLMFLYRRQGIYQADGG